MFEERWPVAYDADEVMAQIRKLTGRADIESEFYEWRKEAAVSELGSVCQGDVVQLPTSIPVIHSDGKAKSIQHRGAHRWLVIGNTCDFTRDLNDAPYTQLVPIVEVGTVQDVNTSVLDAFKKYTHARRFYVPSWSSMSEHRIWYADLMIPVAVSKRVFGFCGGGRSAEAEARLSRPAWILLHTCLIRFLARDDGRYVA